MIDKLNIHIIKDILGRHGFKFSKSLGQNFLTDMSVPYNIAELSDIDESYGIVEVGAGMGVLTAELSKRAGRVCVVEIDRTLLPVLKETLDGYNNIDVVNNDILKTDLHELVKTHLEGYKLAVCANLPYYITTPVIVKIVESKLFEFLTVMVQREVAYRICARPGTADYGAFTLFCNWYCTPEILFEVPPTSFTPQPKVYSAVVKLKMREAPPCEVKDEKLFFKVIKAAFAQRRKVLKNGLSSAFSQFSKEEIGEIIAECGFSETVRGETLGIEEFARLSDAMYNRMNP